MALHSKCESMPMDAGSSACVASTVLGVPAAELETWIRWHLHVGFDLIFLFFDCDPDCDDEFFALEAARRQEWDSRVIITFSDDRLREEQRRRDGRWRTLQPFLDQVPARQELNVESALAMAAARGLRWLLHIDSDELFLPTVPGDDGSAAVHNAVRVHFRALEDAGIGHVTYKNIEGVTEHWHPQDSNKAGVDTDLDSGLRCAGPELAVAAGADDVLQAAEAELEKARVLVQRTAEDAEQKQHLADAAHKAIAGTQAKLAAAGEQCPPAKLKKEAAHMSRRVLAADQAADEAEKSRRAAEKNLARQAAQVKALTAPDPSPSNVFRNVTLFRQHFSDIPLTAAASSCMRSWCQRSAVGQYFLAYDNGKSAVRVLPRTEPRGVHAFLLRHETNNPSGDTDAESALLHVSYIRDIRSNRAAAAPRPPPLPVDGCVLHYVACSFEQWLRKYRTLGRFDAESWLGGRCV